MISKTQNTDLPRRELERIAASRLFARAGKLRQLVQWLGERSLGGNVTKPSEYVVGVEALGKPPDFDPSFDVSVRQLKRRMCARLSQYYLSEGRDSRVRIVCDRGFAVRFEAVPLSAIAIPVVAVMPISGDDSGVLAGALSHALLETGGVRLAARSATASANGVHFLVEGEVLRYPDEAWEMTFRVVDAHLGHVLSGTRLDGNGPYSQAKIRSAAVSLARLVGESNGTESEHR